MSDSGFWWSCGTFTFLVLGAVAVLIAWGVSSPKDPHIFIESTQITGYNLTADNHLTSNFTVNIRAYNPNPMYITYYDVVMVSIHSDTTLLAYDVLGDPLVQQPKDTLLLKAHPAVQNNRLTQGSAEEDANVDGLRKAGKDLGTASLTVTVRASTRFKIKHWKKFHHMTKADCGPIDVKFGSATEAVSVGETRCYVNVY